MYFDKYSKEFNEKGGWEKLKKVSKSYNTVMEFVTIHVISVDGNLTLMEVAEIVHEYEHFIKYYAKTIATTDPRILSCDENYQSEKKGMSFDEKSRADVEKLLQKLRNYTFVNSKEIPKITEWFAERNIGKLENMTSIISIANPNTYDASASSAANIGGTSEVISKPTSSSCHQEMLEEFRKVLQTNTEKSQVLPTHLQVKMSDNLKYSRGDENFPLVKSSNKGIVDGEKRKNAEKMKNKSRNTKSSTSKASEIENTEEKNTIDKRTTSMKSLDTIQGVSEDISNITVLKDKTVSICIGPKTEAFYEKDFSNTSLSNSVVAEWPLDKNVNASVENKNRNIKLEYDESQTPPSADQKCKNIIEKSILAKSISCSSNPESFTSISEPAPDKSIKEKTKANAYTTDIQKHAEGVNITEIPESVSEKEISEQSEILTDISDQSENIENLEEPEKRIYISKIPELVVKDDLNSTEAPLRSKEVVAQTMPEWVENAISPKVIVEKVDNSLVSEAILEKIENIVSSSMSKIYEAAQYNRECKPVKITRSYAQVEIVDNSNLNNLSSLQNIPLTYSDKKVVKNIKNIKNDKSVPDDFENSIPERESKDTDKENVSNRPISSVLANLKTTEKLDQNKETGSSRILEKSENVVKSSGMPELDERVYVDIDHLKDASLPENLFVRSQTSTKKTKKKKKKKSSKKPVDEKSECVPLEGVENIQAIQEIIEDDGNLKGKYQSKIITSKQSNIYICANSIEVKNSTGTPENITSKTGNESDTTKFPKESDKNKLQNDSPPKMPNIEDKFVEYLNHIIGRESKDNIENPRIPIQMSSKSRPTELAEFIHQISMEVPEDTSKNTKKKYSNELNTEDTEIKWDTDSCDGSEISYYSKKSNQKIERIDFESKSTELTINESKRVPLQAICDNLDNATQIGIENSEETEEDPDVLRMILVLGDQRGIEYIRLTPIQKKSNTNIRNEVEEMTMETEESQMQTKVKTHESSSESSMKTQVSVAKAEESLLETTAKADKSQLETTAKADKSQLETAAKADESLFETTAKADESLLETTAKADESRLETTAKTDESRLETTAKADESRLETTAKADESRLETTAKADESRLETTEKADESQMERSESRRVLFGNRECRRVSN
ncbi:hypothetical protein TNCT_469841 [Trichonephila clavata]|uniref:Uncharacterized protein n=1 Tax=Trichonephila clavata TaxID=2740835 RepID=A0A8X6LK26_TRICU|nr:hypothetical protein TNCT_469841 [Trichonephila clavata]